MFEEKSKQFRVSPNKSKLDQILWVLEKYLPQKKNRGFPKKTFMNNLKIEIIRQFSKLKPPFFKRFSPSTKNMIISITFGNWASPYLKLLKKIRITK